MTQPFDFVQLRSGCFRAGVSRSGRAGSQPRIQAGIRRQPRRPVTLLKVASAKVSRASPSRVPRRAVIRFAFISESPQPCRRGRQRNCREFHWLRPAGRFEASTYARNFLQQQIAKTRRDLERYERLMVQYAQQQGIINTLRRARGGSDAGSLQGASMVALTRRSPKRPPAHADGRRLFAIPTRRQFPPMATKTPRRFASRKPPSRPSIRKSGL